MRITNRWLLDRYFMLWSLVLPITSVVLLPTVPGTTPGLLLALATIPLAILLLTRGLGTFVGFLAVPLGLLLALIGTSQLILLLFPDLDVRQLSLLHPFSGRLVFPPSILTQSIYLLAGLATFAFVATHYRRAWDRTILLGAMILALYGLYEFVYFLLFGTNGDFLSNRVFTTGGLEGAGSLFQTFTLAGLRVMRLKSLTGEPSMYAFSVLPFWIYAIHTRRQWLQWLLLGTLVLTTSTTAILGIALYFLLRIVLVRPVLSFAQGTVDAILARFAVISLAVTVIAFPYVNALFSEMVVAKLSVSNHSGQVRLGMVSEHLSFFIESPWLVKLVGIGFGYVRSADFFSTLLVNTGLIGLLAFSALYLVPVFGLRNDNYRSSGLKAILVVVYSCMMVSVPEFAYLPAWLFLGMAYNELLRQRRARRPLLTRSRPSPMVSTPTRSAGPVSAASYPAYALAQDHPSPGRYDQLDDAR